MYPESLLWWLGGTAILFGIIGLIAFFAWYVDHRIQKWQEKKGKEMGTFEDEDKE